MKINQEISLETELPLQSVQDFTMHWEINEHAGLELNGILKNSSRDTAERSDYVGTEITVTLADTIEQNGSGVLFRGLIQEVRLLWSHGVGIIHVKAVSASIKLDEGKQRLCYSFQNPSLSYSDVAKQMSDMGGGAVISTTEKKRIDKPVICYQETIWNFLKRISSYQESFLIPDIKTGRPNLWFGMRSGKQIEVDLVTEQNSVIIEKKYCKNGKSKAVKTYCLECRASYSLGDWVLDNGKKFVIYAMKAKMNKGDISFSYRMASERDIREELYYNEAFTGMNLWGTVEEVKDDTIRITYDMDGVEGDWFYPWRPETGNALYAMPEVGAKVAVYFMNHDEGTGIAVRCLGQPLKNQKPKDKSMTIPSDGKTELFADSINIEKEKDRLELIDSSSINFSGDQIEIEANGKIKLRAKRIALRALLEIKATTE